ncbi:hypothetical protein QE152_g30545 [Popillia japonica]|uniref:Uncharacterized protein n=1 Tax=Popillia japonica TaxID=7064 RepID=A0AAW1JF76_POPJA
MSGPYGLVALEGALHHSPLECPAPAPPRGGTVRSLRYVVGAEPYMLQPNVSPDEVALKGQPALDPVKDRVEQLVTPPLRCKRVIVTPAVYPRLLEFLHVDIQSTGQ